MKIYHLSKLVYHNTKREFVDAIKVDGLTGGTFSTRPIDFGGDIWLAVDENVLGKYQSHQYGQVVALEPNWDELVIHPDNIFLADKKGKVVGKLT
jgi:hypothetical protein